MVESLVPADDLLNGASLRVVLHPDPEVQTDFPDMVESFELPHIILHEGEFIAKTSNRHALAYDFRAYDVNSAFSYAFSNYLSYVVNCSAADSLFRAYSANAYHEIEFVAANTHETVWEYGTDQPTAPVERAIEAGKRLKIALLDADDFWNIHPVHMPSFYVGQNRFELFTEQDAVPEFFRYPSTLKEFSRNLDQQIQERLASGVAKTRKDEMMGFAAQPPVSFYSCYYTLWPNGQYLRGKIVLQGDEPESYKALKIFAEK